MDNIICPNCGKPVAVSQAIRHELEEKITKEQTLKLRAEFEKEKEEETAKQEKKIRQELQEESREKEKVLLESNKKLQEKLEQEEKNRKISEEKIKEEATKEANKLAGQNQDLKLKEKDIQIEQIKKESENIRKANEDLKRKLEQGSQQLQGEALELNLEEQLKQAFPNDEFLPIPKGVEGADIWQKIIQHGKVVGSVLWETKRTKSWSNSWIAKLKNDASKVNASQSIIVSQSIPDGNKVFDVREGVWITSFEYAISLCRYLRILLTTITKVKDSVSHTDEEWKQIREYMTSDAFKHRMETHRFSVKNLSILLEAEKRSTQIRWKKQQIQIEKLVSNNIEFIEELKEIVPNLPDFKALEAELIADESEMSEDDQNLPLL